jgi:membrane protein YdbS with pleckstrin-like domain
MDPAKIRFRYLVGILFSAMLIAAVLRHILHVHVGFTRYEILVGALAVVFTFVVVSLWMRRRR